MGILREMIDFELNAVAEVINTLISGESTKASYYFDLLRPGQIEPGFFIFWQDKFQEVVAIKWEQGSGPIPSRTTVAFKDNSNIFDVPSHLTIIQLKKL